MDFCVATVFKYVLFVSRNMARVNFSRWPILIWYWLEEYWLLKHIQHPLWIAVAAIAAKRMYQFTLVLKFYSLVKKFNYRVPYISSLFCSIVHIKPIASLNCFQWAIKYLELGDISGPLQITVNEILS